MIERHPNIRIMMVDQDHTPQVCAGKLDRMKDFPKLLYKLLITGALLVIFTAQSSAEPQHAIAMHGTPKFPADMTHFPYVNPQAPKGGRLTLGQQGSFDSLNPLIIKGQSAAGVRVYVYESLLSRGLDEPFTLYGLLAQKIDVPEDRSSITFYLNPKAKFSDGKSVTADDVLFSLKTLREKGRPNHRTYYKKVAKAVRIDDLTVRLEFDASGDREMPLIMGLMPILPSHLLTEETFSKTTLKAPVGSGPYKISEVEAGRRIVYKRDPNWWGRDLPVNRGRYNFDEIRFEYFREASVQFEAFKSGALDARAEANPARWAEQYNFPAAADGRVVKQEFEIGLPAGMTALVFNTRREKFQDIRVRQALVQIFDFEWVNRNLFHGLYTRTQSYFTRSALASQGHAANAREKELLAPFGADKIPGDILAGTHRFPVTDGSGQNRANWRKALGLLRKAGYQLKSGKLTHIKTGEALSIEVLAVSPEQERLLLGYKKDLARLGIALEIRVVDSAQYERRRKSYDYDMIQFTWRSSLSPGNEQLFRWASHTRDIDGTYNYAGVADPAVDAMIQAMLEAKTTENFVSAVRALDRVLLSGGYVIPLFHLKSQWLAHWQHLKAPETTPLFGYQLTNWWHATTPAKKAASQKQ